MNAISNIIRTVRQNTHPAEMFKEAVAEVREQEFKKRKRDEEATLRELLGEEGRNANYH